MSEFLARNEAVARTAVGNADWTPWALLALRDAASLLDDLTSDDVWRILHQKGIPSPTEPRAMGPVMLGGVKRGWISPTDRIRSSEDPASPNHARPQRVYASLVRGATGAVWPEEFRCPRCGGGSLSPLEGTYSPRVRMGVCPTHGKTMFVKGVR